MLTTVMAALPVAAMAQAPYVPTAPAAPVFEVTMRVTTQGGGKPAFYGTTNLPEGFEAMATLREGRVTVGPNVGQAVGQGAVVVHAGHFTVGPFSAGGNPLPRGPYHLSIVSPATDLQPESVRKVIGKHGAFLYGPLSEPFSLGGVVYDRTVHFETVVELR
jgi:hypothetical protein